MHVDSASLLCPLIFAAALWRGAQARSLVPSVPDRVQAVVGSCVVIPCSFTPPAPHSSRGKKERVDVRMRFRASGQFILMRSTAFNSKDSAEVSKDFQGRTSLFGRIIDGDCSVKIERIRQGDARKFEMSLTIGDGGLWGRSRSFSLDVVDIPEAPVISGTLAATVGQKITLNCSVSYYCPSTPPALHWIWERGAQINNTKSWEIPMFQPDPNRLILLTTLSFTVSHTVKPRLRCEVRYPGGIELATSKELHVTFPPKDVVVQVQSLMVQEGGSALLACSCKADPPASEYRWSYTQHGRTMHLHHRTHTLRVFNVTRDMKVRCSAQNLIGQGESQPTPLNIQYKPVILQLFSSCVVEDLEVLCHCSVESNPKAVVNWSVNGTAPPHDYNISITSEPDRITINLRGYMDKPQTVICFASNTLGNETLLLLQEGEDIERPLLLWVLIPAAATCLALLLLSLSFCCCRKRVRKQVLGRHPAVYPEGLGIYQDPMPLYINCTEVTHIYTNGSYQLVYQNCTPLFVHTKQFGPMGRRGGERRRRGGDGGSMDRHEGLPVRDTQAVQGAATADPETAIYLEIL